MIFEAREPFRRRVSMQADTPDTGGSAGSGESCCHPATGAADAVATGGPAAAVDPQIVTHFIAGYPTKEASLDVARGLIAGGAFALEMQIPFSDPSADGPVIEAASREALANGFTVADAFDLIRAIRAESDIPLFVMSYASLVVTPGVAEFARRAKDAGASGLIIPDLAPGSDEGLYAAAAEAGCPAVPVVVPWITDERLEEILAEPLEWVYVALRSGITGTYTELGAEQEAFLAKLRERSGNAGSGGLHVMAGFGIQRSEQVAAVVKMADAAIVGSALVNAIAAAWRENSDPKKAGEAARKLTEELLGRR